MQTNDEIKKEAAPSAIQAEDSLSQESDDDAAVDHNPALDVTNDHISNFGAPDAAILEQRRARRREINSKYYYKHSKELTEQRNRQLKERGDKYKDRFKIMKEAHRKTTQSKNAYKEDRDDLNE